MDVSGTTFGTRSRQEEILLLYPICRSWTLRRDLRPLPSRDPPVPVLQHTELAGAQLRLRLQPLSTRFGGKKARCSVSCLFSRMEMRNNSDIVFNVRDAQSTNTCFSPLALVERPVRYGLEKCSSQLSLPKPNLVDVCPLPVRNYFGPMYAKTHHITHCITSPIIYKYPLLGIPKNLGYPLEV